MRATAVFLVTSLMVVPTSSSSQRLPDRDPKTQAALLGVLVNTSVLEALREGKTDAAISILESALDVDLITVSAAPADQGIRNTVRKAAAYRAKYPKQPSSKSEEFVSKYLDEARAKEK